jgi:hypothetical protein
MAFTYKANENGKSEQPDARNVEFSDLFVLDYGGRPRKACIERRLTSS